MRTLHELYRVLLDNYPIYEYDYFLCNNIEWLLDTRLVNKKEQKSIKSHFIKQRPTEKLHSEFYEPKMYTSRVWFSSFDKNEVKIPYDQLLEKQRRFLQKMVEITAPENNTVSI